MQKKYLIYLIGITCLLGFIPVFDRAFSSFRDLQIASRNIYEQQYQMALFCEEYYSNEGVVINDIGAVSYFSNSYVNTGKHVE